MAKPCPNPIYVDVEKFKKELEIRNLTIKKVELEMGHTVGYLSGKLREKGYLSQNDAILLELKYNINRDLYAIKQEENVKKEVVAPVQNISVNVEIDYDKLYQIIYSASHEAMKLALKGEEA